MNLRLSFTPIRNQPFWKFYYKGTHSHPVLRTVLITEIHDNYFTGYELREGKTVRMITDAPIKSYRKNKIAKNIELRNDNPLRNEQTEFSTLRKFSVNKMNVEGL